MTILHLKFRKDKKLNYPPYWRPVITYSRTTPTRKNQLKYIEEAKLRVTTIQNIINSSYG